MNRWAQFAGQIGSMPARGIRFASVANPYVARTTSDVKILRRPVAATATIAGRSGIGCCSGCAADHRKVT